MSDTAQVVHWTLNHSCSLRTAEATRDPIAASAAVAHAHHMGRAIAQPAGKLGLFRGIYITSFSVATLPQRLSKGRSIVDRLLNRKKEGLRIFYPETGEVVSEMFKETGGIAGLKAMCRNCPVNIGRPLPAGCVGHILQNPWSEETQEHLQSIISRLGLAQAIAGHFLPTTPIWYGLWTRSPLSRPAMQLLATLLEELAQARKDDGHVLGWREEFDLFFAATRIAQTGHAALYVKMTSPGHVDMGWHTTFVHCPRCKAGADLPNWKRKYPVAQHICRVCGQSYSPAQRHSSTHIESDKKPTLREILRKESFRTFAREYLIAQGISPADAAETVELSEAAEVERQAKRARSQREWKAQERYIEQSLYAGLCKEALDDPDDPGAALVKGFRSPDFDRLLRRAAERGIKTPMMSHRSVAEEMDRHAPGFTALPWEPTKDFDPLDVFQKWKAEGCDGIFIAYFNIPRALIEAFEAENPT